MAMFSTFVGLAIAAVGRPLLDSWLALTLVAFGPRCSSSGSCSDRSIDAPLLSHIVVFIALFGILNSAAGFVWDYNVKTFPDTVRFASAVRPAD